MSNNPDKLNIDQLLDLKRAEKPGDDFWEGFQREFRQRQLQTLIEKEPKWKHFMRFAFSRSSLLVPLSGVAAAVFVLTLNFQKEEPRLDGYLEGAEFLQSSALPDVAEVAQAVSPDVPAAEEAQPVSVDAFPGAASFVMDMIPNEEPESLNYTREFPTSTIQAEKRTVGALVSYTIARDNPSFGFNARPQTIGF